MLSDDKTYTKLNGDPTANYKRKLVALLNNLLKANKIDENQKRFLYPTAEVTPRLYCTPKIHKTGCPLRPIVDYTDSIMYNLSRSLADLLNPVVGKTKHHVNNAQELVSDLKTITLGPEETFVSFDVTSLFTNTPIDIAIEVARARLTADKSLKK